MFIQLTSRLAAAFAAPLMLGGILMIAGCASQQSTRAKPLNVSSQAINLSRYDTVTVVPFEVLDTAADSSVGAKLADDVASRLRHDFPGLFREVRSTTLPGRGQNELLVTGDISHYRPGSKARRMFLPPFGASNLKGHLLLQEAGTGETLFTAPFRKLWAWHGPLGASKGIDEMRAEVAAAIANTIARSKGWVPGTIPVVDAPGTSSLQN